MRKTKATTIISLLVGLLLLGLGVTNNKSDNNPSFSIVQEIVSPSLSQPSVNQSGQTIKITRVIDGDTIEIEGGQKVRYIGVDTPETVDPRREVGCFGKEASDKNKELVEGKEVRLEKDISDTDKYGRLLRYVYVGNLFINDYLVRQGYARVSTYPPDVKYQQQFLQAQQEAVKQNLGLWGANCQYPTPSKVSSSNQAVLAQVVASSEVSTNQNDCLIKGNISSAGEKIYHLPDQRYYDKTVIETSKGEQYFCSENEAQSAGYRKSKV